MESFPFPDSEGDDQLARLVEYTRRFAGTPLDVARLAVRLANSGMVLSWPDLTNTADIASTGGPGSLSTLITPLVLRALGCHVIKLAVPGRPAGAIDSLATIPGYKPHLVPAEVESLVRRVGIAHFLADHRFAPLDAALFSYRRNVDAVAIPMLAAASLLSKKIAVGLKRVGLDVRVGTHGNFGRSFAEARANGELFSLAARELNMDPVVFLTDAGLVSQPWIGRGESLLALAWAIGAVDLEDPEDWLKGHVTQCFRMAEETAVGVSPTSSSPTSDELQRVLREHLSAQGANWTAFMDRVESVADADRVTIEAPSDGLLSVDLGGLRDEIVALQGGPGVEPFMDPAGLQLLVKPGTTVIKGQPLARFRCPATPSTTQTAFSRLEMSFRVSPRADLLGAIGPRPMEVIRA